MAGVMFHHSFLQDSVQDVTAISNTVILDNGVQLKLWRRGVLEVIPASVSRSTKHIILSSGVHGNETAPIEIVDQLATDILQQKWQPQCRLLLIIAHFEAMHIEKRFVETNLNRLFADIDYPDSKELAIAQQLKCDVADFFKHTAVECRWHFDMHCSIRKSIHYTFAISPQSAFKTRSVSLIDFLEKSGVEAILLSEEASSTFSWLSSSVYGAQALTLELGQVAQFGYNDMGKLDAFITALRELIKGDALSGTGTLQAYQVACSIYRQREAFEFSFANELPNFTKFTHKQQLGWDGSEPITMPVENGAIVFPNPSVEIKQRAALIVAPCTPVFVDGQWQY
ncbi:succinylglutamate desuccinylase [Vibrio gallicus]|uniref:succinylglutamate desuccinylase n=1 Tax=Vibrio gallicus TaxID=190897 RepID=UPI0021C4B3F3|nr:succinylglutamate desuccinylase [Vibrio gallicus]